MQNYKKPVLLLGQGAKGSKYREYAEKYQFPIVVSRLGIGLIEYTHPLYVGHTGNYGDVASMLAIKNADLIFVAGCRLASALVGYNPSEWGKKAHKLVVDIDPLELSKPGIKIDTPINTTCERFFDKLLKAKKGKPVIKHKRWIKQCQKWKKEYQVVTKEMSNGEDINSYVFTDRLSMLSSRSDIVVVDTGSCFHVVAQAWRIKKGQKFITTGGLSSMGWWAASIGAGVLGHTICITGDGSFHMNIQELATIKKNKLPIKIFVFNNGGYGLIRATQKRFKLKLMGESPKTGVWFPELKRISQAYKIPYYKIDSSEISDTAIEMVLSNECPTICEVRMPKDQKLLRPNDLSIARSVSKKAK